MFGKYFKYISLNLIKNSFVYFSVASLLFVSIILFYIIPAILKVHLSIITNYVYFFLVLILFGVFNVATIVSAIFRKSIDDGSDLIIQSKPIGRSYFIYSKILLFFICILLIALLNAIIVIFTSFSKYSDLNTSSNIALNVFLGTIISYLFFGSIGILFSIFLNSLSSIICTISVFLILMTYSVITNTVFMSVSKYLRKKDNIYLTPVSLVLNNQDQKMNYYGGVVGSFNNSNSYITQEIYNQMNLQNIKPQEFLSYKWNETIKENNFLLYLYTNFSYQIASIYTQKDNQFWQQPFSQFSYFLHSSNAFNINLKFKDTINDSLFKPNMINIDNQSYILTNNMSMIFSDKNKNIYETQVKTNHNNGTISFFDQSTKLPTNIENNILNEISFDYSIKSLQSFVDTYYSQSHLKKYETLVSSLKDINALSYYATLFNSLNIEKLTNYNPIFPLQNYIIQKTLDKTSIDLTKFQYLSFLSLKDSNLLLSTKQVDILQNVISSKNIVSFFIPYNFSGINLLQYLENPYISKPFFEIINNNFLLTFNFVDIYNFYNYYALLFTWLIVSLILLLLAIAIYFRHDFY